MAAGCLTMCCLLTTQTPQQRAEAANGPVSRASSIHMIIHVAPPEEMNHNCCPWLQAASAWAAIEQTDPSDWCYQQLCKHLCSIAAAGANQDLRLDTRRALQRLQFTVLSGNLSLAARQGHQVRDKSAGHVCVMVPCLLWDKLKAGPHMCCTNI
jgi:hypothetical protein